MVTVSDETGCAVDVVVPTRNRPGKLARCLNSLAGARDTYPFRVYAVDSSTTSELRTAVDEVCARFPFVSVHRHNRHGLAAARNECTLAGTAPLIVSVDDDVYVAPAAITRLVERYAGGQGWRIVAGSVFWGEDGSGPVRMRRIGYGIADPDETQADFYVTALILYPRAMARQCQFNEHIASSDDRFIGALWRSKEVHLLWEATAQGKHDDEHNTRLQTAKHHDSHIYVNLFDALFVRRSVSWTLSFEFIGFAAGAKLHSRRPGSAIQYCSAWLKGNLLFMRDWRRLKQVADAQLVGEPPEV
jgi:glycosyltransferase involved in cell wall biosynthesis